MAEKHVYIFGEIGWENNVQSIAAQTKGTTAEDTLIVHIHSPGGDVNEGFAIYDHLVSFGATVETRIEGLCASIATIIAMAGTKRTMTENSNFFVHNPWTFTEGDAAQLQETADQLKAVEEKIAAFYSKNTGKEKDEMLLLMADASDITPDKAKELGFITEVVKPVLAMARYKSSNPNNSNIESIMSKFLNEMRTFFSGFKAQQEPGAGAKNLDTTLEDGTAIMIEGESVAVGAAVTLSESGEPAPDGQHILADGTTITTEGGVITEVVEAAATLDAEALKSENEALKAELTETQNLLKDFKAEMETFKASLEQKQPIFNRVQRTKINKATEVKDRTGGKDQIVNKLNETNPKKKK
jgi:ATP-dependent protease ClpP protease subunit